jgi:mycoredoxin
LKDSDLFSLSPKTTVVYTKSWCPDCRRARRVIMDFKHPFFEIDISGDDQAREFIRQINHGNESVPTIIFPDGTILVEPKNAALVEKLKMMD